MTTSAHTIPSQPRSRMITTLASISSSSRPSSPQLSHRDANERRAMDRRRSSAVTFDQTTCHESYKLFKKCSMSRETEGFSCSDAVKSYMHCALNDCC
mmetsp:Transcript_5569/g.10163  ORF Transcript_5569/g.10163 Transcript_5569/m.10163 type:complete len:98 (+) Transcript_5569:110-403(+)